MAAAPFPWSRLAFPATLVLVAAGVAVAVWGPARRAPSGAPAADLPVFAVVTDGQDAQARAPGGGPPRLLHRGDDVFIGDVIETAETGNVAFSDNEGLEIELGPLAALALEDELRISRGTVSVHAGSRPSSHALRLHTPHAVLTVVDAGFLVEVTAPQTRLEVQQGEVIFERGSSGTTATIRAGQTAAAGAAEGTIIGGDSPGPDPNEEVVLAFDFEDGQVPPIFRSAQLALGPPREGNRHCALATEVLEESAAVVQLARAQPPLFRQTDRTYLTFDYWMDARLQRLSVRAWAGPHLYGLDVEDPVREAWAHVEVATEDLATADGPSGVLSLNPGDVVGVLQILASPLGGGALHVDNLRVVRRLDPSASSSPAPPPDASR